MIYDKHSDYAWCKLRRTKKAILFDIDGTILDAWDFVFKAVEHAAFSHGYPYPTDENIRQALGKPLGEFYQTLMPGVDPKKLSLSHRSFQQDHFHLVKPYPKTKKVLRELKKRDYLIAAVSNRMRESLHKSLKLTKILKYFNIVISAEDTKKPKPDKEHLLAALKFLKVEVGDAYMVGDTDQDVLAGQNAGVKTIGVTYGFLGPEIKKYKPDFIIDDLEELLKILDN